MLGVRWNGTIDLINSCQFRVKSNIDFKTDILAGKSLYYKDGLKHYQI